MVVLQLVPVFVTVGSACAHTHNAYCSMVSLAVNSTHTRAHT